MLTRYPPPPFPPTISPYVIPAVGIMCHLQEMYLKIEIDPVTQMTGPIIASCGEIWTKPKCLMFTNFRVSYVVLIHCHLRLSLRCKNVLKTMPQAFLMLRRPY